MTYESIYRRICRELWGSTIPPQLAQDMLPNSGGLIAEEQRKVQQEYNYWFMKDTDHIHTTATVNSYALPADFKEFISGQWKVDGETYFKKPSSPLALRDARDRLAQTDITEEYPEFFEISNANIVFYHPPKYTDYKFHFDYWKFIEGPQFSATFTSNIFTAWAGTDDVTAYAGLIIVYRVCSILERIMDENEKSDRFAMQALKEEETLKMEDRSRRQKILTQAKHKDY